MHNVISINSRYQKNCQMTSIVAICCASLANEYKFFKQFGQKSAIGQPG